jgi:hypothetical protein
VLQVLSLSAGTLILGLALLVETILITGIFSKDAAFPAESAYQLEPTISA